MKKNLIALLFLFLLGGAAYYFSSSEKANTLTSDDTAFAVADTSAVTKIYMADKKGNDILLERLDEDTWEVNRTYFARQDVIKTLLATMKELKVKAPVPKAAYNTVVKKIASLGTKVEIYTGGEDPSKVYYIGTPDLYHSGSYMLLEGADNPYLMHIEGQHGYLSPRYVMHEQDYRRNVIFNHDPRDIASISLNFPQEPQRNYAIHATNEFFEVRNSSGQVIPNLDSTQLISYLNYFRKVNFEAVVNPSDPNNIDSVFLTLPEFEMKLTDRSGKTTEVAGYKKPVGAGFMDLDGNEIDYDLDRMYGHLNMTDTVLLQYHHMDPILKQPRFFSK